MFIKSKIFPLSFLFVLNLYIRPTTGKALRSYSGKQALQKRFVADSDLTACQIYCYGPLLHTIQMAKIFEDSKTFVDMKLKYSPEQTTVDFQEFMISKDHEPTKADVTEFVNEHFEDLGKEFEPWEPTDWVEHPQFLKKIVDPDLRQWGYDLNGIWKELGRKMIDDVYKNPEFYSIIPVPFPVIVPGGRFKEFYYWDSYWIIRGILLSEMYTTAKGMLENFLSIIQRYGFIPNGGRIYYAKRSQPPLLAAMIHSYAQFTNDTQFAIDALDILEHEFEYWINNHTVQVKRHNLMVYGDASTGPRPESYREDIESSKFFETVEDREEYYSELKAAAESGMDFSSRWFINDNGSREGNLTTLKTRSIIPVELNAILYWNAKIISEYHMKANDAPKFREYGIKAEKIKEAIQAIHWNEEDGIWYDYDLINNRHRKYFVPTNLSPLWTMAFNVQDADNLSTSVLKYIDKLELDIFPGGVPNTLYDTGEQWDFPNVWPPMQYMLIQGLNNLGTLEAKMLAKRWANRWVLSNFEAYRHSRTMFEKYDAAHFGSAGGGGEYEIQKGFGWTNGVILEFLEIYGREFYYGNNSGSVMTKFSLLSPVFTVMFLYNYYW